MLCDKFKMDNKIHDINAVNGEANEIEKGFFHNQPITLSWENVNVHTPGSKAFLCFKENLSKHIVKDGNYSDSSPLT